MSKYQGDPDLERLCNDAMTECESINTERTN
jgi:hypothetical protein